MENAPSKHENTGKEGGIFRILQVLIQVIIVTVAKCNHLLSNAGLEWLQSENIFRLYHFSPLTLHCGLLVYPGEPTHLTSLPCVSFEQFEK